VFYLEKRKRTISEKETLKRLTRGEEGAEGRVAKWKVPAKKQDRRTGSNGTRGGFIEKP